MAALETEHHRQELLRTLVPVMDALNIHSLRTGNMVETDRDGYFLSKWGLPGSLIFNNSNVVLSTDRGTQRRLDQVLSGYLQFLNVDPPHPSRLGVAYVYKDPDGILYWRSCDQFEQKDAWGNPGPPLINRTLRKPEEIKEAMRLTLAQAYMAGHEDAKLAIYDSDRSVWTELERYGVYQLDRVPEDIGSKSDRIKGWLRAQEVGIRLPEGMVVIGNEVFQKYLEQGDFSTEVREVLTRLALQELENFPKVSVRRAYTIPGLPRDPGKARGILVKGEQSSRIIDEVRAMYEEACALAYGEAERQVLARERLDKGVYPLTNEILTGPNSSINVVLHQRVDPLAVELHEGQVVLENESVRLPASVSIIPLDPDGRYWQVDVRYGDAGGNVTGASLRYQVMPTDIIQPVSGGDQFSQKEMLCTVGGKQQKLLIPISRQNCWPISSEEIPNLVRQAYQLQVLGKAKGDFGENTKLGYRIEGSLGERINLVQGPETSDVKKSDYVIYATQVSLAEIPYLPLEAMDITRELLTVSDEASIDRISELLKRQGDRQLFIGIPARVFDEERILLETKLTKALAGKSNVIVLVGADLAAGHYLNDLAKYGIPYLCIGNFPIEQLDGRIRLTKPEGFDIDEIAMVLDENQVAVPIADVWKYGRSQFGNKTYMVSMLNYLGLPIAKAVGVPARAFEQTREALGLTNTFRDFLAEIRRLAQQEQIEEAEIKQVIDLGKRLAERITTVPPAVVKFIDDQLGLILGPDKKIMVRSSCRAEDDVAHSGAGKYVSVGGQGDLTRENLKDGLIKVYQSLFSEQSIRYLIGSFKDNLRIIDGLTMPVHIPEYVSIGPDDFSFYLFTQQPGRQGQALLNLSKEAGETIASGRGKGFNILFEKKTGKIIGQVPPGVDRVIVEQAIQTLTENNLLSTLEGVLHGAADIEGALKWQGDHFSPIFHQARRYFC